MKRTIIRMLVLSLILGVSAFNAYTQTPNTPTQTQQTKQAFYCGAKTKAGTPCKHRVKVQGTHCYQHQGESK